MYYRVYYKHHEWFVVRKRLYALMCLPTVCPQSQHNAPHNIHDLCIWVDGCASCAWMPLQSDHCLPLPPVGQLWEWMTNCSIRISLYPRSLKTQRERTTRQICPAWPRLPPRMVLRSTSYPSLRSHCLYPNSLEDPVRKPQHLQETIKRVTLYNKEPL